MTQKLSRAGELTKMFFRNWWKVLVTVCVLLSIAVACACAVMWTVSKTNVGIHTDKFDVTPMKAPK